MKLHPKIDLYFAGDYLCSTKQSKTCKEAIQRYLDRAKLTPNLVLQSRILKNPSKLKARFDKDER